MTPRVAVVTEAQYAPGCKGGVVSLDGVNGDRQWRRYGRHLPGLVVIGRYNATAAEGAPLNDHPLRPLPAYSGPAGLVRQAWPLCRELWKAMDDVDMLILRLPGPLGSIAALLAWMRGRPYVAEVVGDAGEVLTSGAVGTAGRLLAPLARIVTRTVVARATAVRYVTREALQRRYPAGQGAPQLAVPNVQLAASDYVDHPRSRAQDGSLRLLAIGSQETTYKGHDIVIKALRALLDQGHEAHLVLVGAGRTQSSLRQLSERLELEDHVTFAGHVERRRVTEFLGSADVLLHPSRTEGLPRVVLEAAAQALPVVGTPVGGLPEVVAPVHLVPRDDHQALADAIVRLTEAGAYESSSAWGLRTARQYDAHSCELLFSRWTATVAELAQESFVKP